MRILISVITSLLLVIFEYGCDEKHKITPEEEEWSRCDLIANRITYNFSIKMYETEGLINTGTGGGGPGKLRMLSVSFDCYQKMDISQARKLLLECVDEFLAEINKTPEIAPYSREFPYTFKNVNIDILFIDKETRNFLSPPSIAAAGIKEGVLDYSIHQDERLKFIKFETYEEALKIVEQDKRM